MIDHSSGHLEEFFHLHRQELERRTVAKVTLFSDYVAFCNDRDYRHHTNLVTFCKALDHETQSPVH